MRVFEGYQRGVNLGGWLSQCVSMDEAHFDTFITEADIARIAGWGLDHVVVDGDTHVVKALRGDLPEIVLRDKAVQALLAVIALAQPAAQVDASIKSVFFQHGCFLSEKRPSRGRAVSFFVCLRDQPLTEPAVTPRMMDLDRMM